MTKTKATKPAKESGHARHLRLKAAGLCTACGKRKAATRPASKGGGHDNEFHRPTAEQTERFALHGESEQPATGLFPDLIR
jgi:hypothetical protein